MEITPHDHYAVVAASSGSGQPIGEWCVTGEAIATELRGHRPDAAYVHNDVALEVDVEAVAGVVARKVGRRDVSVKIVRSVGGLR